MTAAPPSAGLGSASSGVGAGVAFALAAGLMWGLVFVAPTVLADYPPLWLAIGRYTAFGLIALPLALLDWRALRRLPARAWGEALALSFVGNLLYYTLLASAIQRSGGPLPTMVIGTLPVVIALLSNRGAARLPWARLAPSLLLIAAGIASVNRVEMAALLGEGVGRSMAQYVQGAALAVGALVCWTWYPLRNAAWMRAHPHVPSRAWATAQGIVTLPMALGAGALAWGAGAAGVPVLPPAFDLPWGPRPAVFVGLMLLIGFTSSWLGTLCWNAASQRVPRALLGQMIVFETLAALAYAYLWRAQWPPLATLLGAALLMAGVAWALWAVEGAQPAATASQASP